MVTPHQPSEQLEVTSRTDLRRWLETNHSRSTGLWLISFKKGSDHFITYHAIVEECLCFGWIDSRPRALDATRSMRYIAPRKDGSAWSKINKARVADLIENGLMTDAGLCRVSAAKADGSWSLLDDVDDGIAPADLTAALDCYPNARAHFDAFPPSSKKIILEWIKMAKRSETRRKRIQITAEKAERNERENHYR